VRPAPLRRRAIQIGTLCKTIAQAPFLPLVKARFCRIVQSHLLAEALERVMDLYFDA